jgi:hypothetical protein
MEEQHVKKFLGEEETATWTFQDKKDIENSPHTQIISLYIKVIN